MNKMATRALSALAATTLIIGLAACGNDSQPAASSLPDAPYKVSASEPAWKKDTRSKNTLTWYVNADWWNKTWNQDLITKQIAKDLHLNVKFTIGDDTKLNTLFASGDLPDIVTVFDVNSKVVKSAPQWAWPLKDLANKYDPYFNKVARADTMDWYKASDGKTYGYPSYSNTAADYKSGMIKPTQAFVIRKDVRQAIGDQDFTTPEGFRKGMQAIKEKFPSLIPFGVNDFSGGNSSLDGALQDQLGIPIVEGNKIYDRRSDPEYLKWLNTLREVHADGNMSDDTFADDGDTFKEKVSTGKYATMLINNFVGIGTQLQTFASSQPNEAYEAIDGMMSQKNKPILSQSGLSGWSISFISRKSKNPSKAIQTFEYLLSDYGEMLTNFGIEGQTYTKNADGTVSWTKQADEVRLKDTSRWQKEYRMGEFVLFGHDRYKALSKDSFVPAIWQMQEWGQKYLYPHFITENTSPDPSTPAQRAQTAIETQFSTTLVSMIRSKSKDEFDKLWAQFEQFRKQNNYDAVVKATNEKVAKNAKRLESMK